MMDKEDVLSIAIFGLMVLSFAMGLMLGAR